MIQGYHNQTAYEQADSQHKYGNAGYHAVTQTNADPQPTTYSYYQPTTTTATYQPAYQGTSSTATYTPTKQYADPALDTRYSPVQQSPQREVVRLVESHPEYKVYQYKSVKKESIHIEDQNRRVVVGNTYSDGTPVKRSTYGHENSPEIPFNPRRSTTYSNSKFITVVRNGREVKEEIYDYN